ncbi:hypothetical protein MRX96_001651 [Rhipicephalus microplus]
MAIKTFLNQSRVVVNAALLSVSLADSIWDAVFSSRDWAVPLMQRLDAQTSCLERYIRSKFGGRLSYPLLSIRSVVRAVAWPQWHRRADDDWKIQSFMIRIDEFASAFDCKPAPLMGWGSCL